MWIGARCGFSLAVPPLVPARDARCSHVCAAQYYEESKADAEGSLEALGGGKGKKKTKKKRKKRSEKEREAKAKKRGGKEGKKKGKKKKKKA